jgi:hypothetical protein
MSLQVATRRIDGRRNSAATRPRRLCQHRRMNRIVLWLAALLCVGLVQAAPPQRNLSVEMRVSDDQADGQRDARGSVTVGSRGGGATAGASVVVQAGSSRQASDATQRVLVLNGGRATLRLVQGMPIDDTEVWWTPWGAGAAVRSQWVELVNGMDVQPRWPGGDAPVTLEIGAQSAGRATPHSGQPLPPLTQVFTTVQVPLGEWVEVARVQGRQSAVSSGGFGAATSSRQRSLQLRVSLP